MKNISAPETVLISEDGGVLTFTLNNPQSGNEVSAAMMEAMKEALAVAALDPAVRVLRLRAKGDTFCMGRERAGRDATSIHAEVARLISLKAALRSTTLISIAEVQGTAHGFGVGLAMLCDFTLVASNATLAFPEMRKGLPPAAIMAYLGHYALPKAAFPLVLFGRDFTPHVALGAGLITQICAPDSLHGDADALALEILALDPDGARHCKRYFQAAQEGTLEQNFRLANETLTVNSMRLMAAAQKS